MISATLGTDHNLTILVSGAIRDTAAFQESLHAASVVAKEAGLSKAKIVISTWDSDYPKAKKICSEIACENCNFVVTSSRSIPCDFSGNWIRQSILLTKGLTAIWPNSFVIKMRTDKTEWVTGFAKQVFHLPELPDPQSRSFSKRIIIPSAIVLEPYFYNDMVYAGIASDLLRLVPRLMQPLVEQWIINPEQIFHIAPVLEEHEDIAKFFHQNRGLPHGYEPEQLKLRNEGVLSDKLHLKMAIQSLEHLLQAYAFPSDFDKGNSDSDDLISYVGNTKKRLVEIMSEPPPNNLHRHLRFNDSAKSLVVSSSHSTSVLLNSLKAHTSP